ncbi:Mitochondrial carrier protein [Histomonas meleagridis]|uniref:Mitochondrial carrier protein n=1 Tax=Histomonas meleagridis TaxID=135588 RepID=UPI00355A337F|nr:Mitochondrial carrier protein [Histomonas meleagridis]KAH0806930.1 Mitochondrial carrier protein [Histomonas meleagridis]
MRTKSTEELSPIQNILCGFAGVVIPRTMFAPLESIKIIAINNDGKPLFSALKKKIVTEGIPSLWNGFLCDWIRIPPQFVVRYILANSMKKINPNGPKWLIDQASALASVTMFHPLDVIHTLMTYDIRKYPSISKTMATILKEDGISGLYRGLVPTILGYIPYHSTQYFSTFLFNRLQQFTPRNASYSFSNDALLSIAVVTLAQGITYPFEVVRKRMMTDEKFRKKSFVDVFKHIYKTRGLRGFYDSFGISMCRVIPVIWIQQAATREFRALSARFNYQMKYHKF